MVRPLDDLGGPRLQRPLRSPPPQTRPNTTLRFTLSEPIDPAWFAALPIPIAPPDPILNRKAWERELAGYRDEALVKAVLMAIECGVRVGYT
ncbi:hypothetical protein HDU96_003184, partial [Phlyctochytrium bullatum]